MPRLCAPRNALLLTFLGAIGCSDNEDKLGSDAQAPAAGAAGAAGQSGSVGQGGSGAQPCNGDCGGETPICEPEAGACVECSTDDHCGRETPVCHPTTNACVGCLTDEHCSGETARCDLETTTCVECTEAAHCTDATEARCNAGTCAPCETNADCTHLEGKGVCDAGQCVQCTGRDYAVCGTDPTTGAARVCDSRRRECSPATAGSTGLCGPCVSDAQCAAGQLCVLQQFGEPAQDVGYFCFWKQGDTAPGSPADCATQGRPYVRLFSGAMSIDGTTADICGLRVSTCIAGREFSSKPCVSETGAPDNALCGFAAPNDALCTTFGAGHLCTMRCLSELDCPDTACNIEAQPRYCEL